MVVVQMVTAKAKEGKEKRRDACQRPACHCWAQFIKRFETCPVLFLLFSLRLSVAWRRRGVGVSA